MPSAGVVFEVDVAVDDGASWFLHGLHRCQFWDEDGAGRGRQDAWRRVQESPPIYLVA
jgi:hypothetical protein